ncbi:PD-(D/E)XK nuclease family protein [Lacticaseibacillus kribbianus]|uniref:PD-(D/E)XK nuclease family protein n=1 Tax=Lacticaseibacillus kribbianus TaxID=2926292 RepID=UPI001CD4AE1D|nr:PD-(D/E)XK nuclease family protein [Lacticaseibacillus kribbianus]
MGLQFILGTAAADHHRAIIDAMAATRKHDKDARIFYLVPNHVKFEAEVGLLQGLRGEAAVETFAEFAVQTFSPSRLAWYFLKNDPVYQQPRLDGPSNTMLVARLLAEHQDELRVYPGEANKPGFIAQLAKQLAELTQGRVSADDLRQVVQDLPATSRQGRKFADLAVLLDAYTAAIGPYVTNASLVTALASKLAGLDLAHTYFYLEHFNELSATERNLVVTLMQHAKEVTVALVLDRGVTAVPAPPCLFLPAARLYVALVAAAKDAHIQVHVDRQAPKRALSAGMAAVADFWVADTHLDPLPKPKDVTAPAGVTLAVASSPYVELRQVAIRINQLVHQGARYQDFLVMARHLDPYKDLIAPVFNSLGVPVFVDVEHPMQDHPLMALIDSLFAVWQHHFQYQDVMRLLRTELLLPEGTKVAAFRAALDVCDNHLLRTGIAGSLWLQKAPWQYFQRYSDSDRTDNDPEKSAQINLIKDLIAARVAPLFAQLDQSESGREAAATLYTWLVESGVQKQLEAWRAAAIAAGDIAASTAGEQAWATFVSLLDDYVTILGDTAFDRDQFIALMTAGIAGATFTQIPATLDQVVVSETALARQAKFAHVFVIGATSGVMPDTPTDAGVLTAADRSVLQERLPDGAYLPQTGADTTLGDPFVNYLGMMAGATTLTVSYPTYAEDQNQASPYLTAMRERLGLTLELWSTVTPQTPPRLVAGTARSLLSDFITVARLSRDQNRPVATAWQGVYAALRKDPKLAGLTARLAASIDYKNAVGKLDPSLARKLYGENLKLSVSRLESFYKNPYEYFLAYGLRLNTRPEFELTPADLGTLYHDVAATLVAQWPLEQLQAQTAESLQAAVAARLAEDVATMPQYQILLSSHAMQAVQGRIAAMLAAVLAAVSGQLSHAAFRPRATELAFGALDNHEGSLPPLILPVAGGGSISVRGKIDRLDRVQVDGQDYFLVVDYKSSSHDFDPQKAYYGVSLQLLTYIDAYATGTTSPALAAGGVYMMFKRPRLKYAARQNPEQATAKEHRMSGLLVVPEEPEAAVKLAVALDSDLAHGGKSTAVPIGVTAKGAIDRSFKKLLTPGDLAAFVAHNRRMIQEAAAKILTGAIDLAPIQFDQESTVITNSDYQAIMLFDPATGFDQYRHVTRLSLPEVLALLAKEDNDGIHD